MRLLLRGLITALMLAPTGVQASDQRQQAWTALLQRHVVWLPGGHESRTSYAGFQRDHAALKSRFVAIRTHAADLGSAIRLPDLRPVAGQPRLHRHGGDRRQRTLCGLGTSRTVQRRAGPGDRVGEKVNR